MNRARRFQCSERVYNGTSRGAKKLNSGEKGLPASTENDSDHE